MLREYARVKTGLVVSILVLLFLSLLLAAIAIAAVGQATISDKGGIITIDKGVQLVIPPRALDTDTYIKAKMVWNTQKVTFQFEPKGNGAYLRL